MGGVLAKPHRGSTEMSLYVKNTYIDADQGHVFGYDQEYVEAFTDDRGELYRFCQREFGRCVSKIYQEGDNKTYGWVFQGRDKYQDSDKTYLREVWVHVTERVS
jgi:hypothetical protein